METPQVPALAGMTPLGLAEERDAHTVPHSLLDSVEAQWISRVQSQVRMGAMLATGKRYQDAEREFFIGAMAAFVACGMTTVPPRWVITMMRGDRVVPLGRIVL